MKKAIVVAMSLLMAVSMFGGLAATDPCDHIESCSHSDGEEMTIAEAAAISNLPEEYIVSHHERNRWGKTHWHRDVRRNYVTGNA